MQYCKIETKNLKARTVIFTAGIVRGIVKTPLPEILRFNSISQTYRIIKGADYGNQFLCQNCGTTGQNYWIE